MNTLSGKPRFDTIKVLCQLDVGKNVFLDQKYSALIVSREYGKANRSLLVHLVRGVAKFRTSLDSIARQYLSRWERLSPVVRNALRVGIFQLVLDLRTPSYAVVHESVELVRTFHESWSVPLVNAVLRHVADERDRYHTEAAGWGMDCPDWLEQEWEQQIGREEVQRLKKSLALPPILYLRVNTLKITPEDFLSRMLNQYSLSFSSFSLVPGALRTTADYSELVELPEFGEGYFSIQDGASQLMVHLFSPQPGERVVDMCCGRGGKSVLMAQLMKNHGTLYAVDVNPDRLERLMAGTMSMGVDIIHPVQADATKTLFEYDIKGVDRIFVDAPCSGFGTLRRNPEITLHRTREDCRILADRQVAILESSLSLLKPGGMISYCVCTQTEEETSDVVKVFESHRPGEVERIDLSDLTFLLVGSFGVDIWPYQYETDGFFYTAWRKK
ncbi:MAG: class I SAM-dependent methyltransferase [Candidatus Atribacteria bacterium]|nr:class I SAM-dependent methyltransferase [Candidatus Atribacteria bacterium]